MVLRLGDHNVKVVNLTDLRDQNQGFQHHKEIPKHYALKFPDCGGVQFHMMNVGAPLLLVSTDRHHKVVGKEIRKPETPGKLVAGGIGRHIIEMHPDYDPLIKVGATLDLGDNRDAQRYNRHHRTKQKSRLGKCYQLAAQYQMDNPDTILQHGTITGMGKPPLEHAWVKHPDNTYWEPSTNMEWAPDAFGRFFNPDTHIEYTSDEALDQMDKHGHYGPWHDERKAQKDIPQTLYHATYQPYLDSINKHGLGGVPSKPNWTDSKSGVIYLSDDPNVAESYAESSEDIDEDFLNQIIILAIDTASLDRSKLFTDSNNQQGDTFEYHGVIPQNAIRISSTREAQKRINKGLYEYQFGDRKFQIQYRGKGEGDGWFLFEWNGKEWEYDNDYWSKAQAVAAMQGKAALTKPL